MYRSICVAFLALVFTVLCSNVTKAAEEEKTKANHAVTLFSEADGDFAFQGEYRCEGLCPFGLQVVALGDAQFEAVAFPGGLPGAGWNRFERLKLKGKLDGDRIRLEGEQLSAEVYANESILRWGNGTSVTLGKVLRSSPTMNLPPPSNAVVLFDGQSLSPLEGARFTRDGYLSTGVMTKMAVHDFDLHIEFRTPYMPHARGQGRGNSGVYVQQRYEVQILDSFGLEGVENECGSLYKQRRPLVNMCLPPLSWQTYDIHFVAARWYPDGTKAANARITVLHNGVPVQQDQDILSKTGAGKEESPDPRPILLQHHGNPVSFRNVWIVPHQLDSTVIAVSSLASVASDGTRACERELGARIRQLRFFRRF